VRLAPALASLLAAVAVPLGLTAPAAAAPARELCGKAVAMAEELRPDLPEHLMTAMSKVETGRGEGPWPERFAWPWTINVDGEGRFYPSKAAAVDAVERLRAEGADNIDVGCMQISLQYHGDAFDSLEAAFNPAVNVAYAVEFLMALHRRTNSWMEAIGDYHSRNRAQSLGYRRTVIQAWNAEKRAHYANAEHRADSPGA